ncbi:MAG: bifunctional DNA-formamidopyrimidine glycosylase/DNA-(apurinic or apyrimidinic site) lyase [Rhodocyclaceae bacterium]
MPELPEVETTRRGVAPWVEGRVVRAVVVRHAGLRLPVPAELGTRLVGHAVAGVRRRAKYLLFDMPGGGLLIHLGMSGSLRLVEKREPPGNHDHVDLDFGERVLRYRDPRRFGLIVWQDGLADDHPLLARLGPEPLDEVFDAAYLVRTTRGLRVPVKQAIMDGHRVVGVGNIYASESLFRARIHPLQPAGEIGLRRYRRLVESIRGTLTDAIAAGGSSLRDFVGGDGRPGYFQQQYFVYGRDGAPCRVCGTLLRRMVIGQRASYWCPRCQRR